VEVLTDRPAERFAVGRHLYREDAAGPLTIVAAAPDGPGWRLRFAEIADRSAAETLRDAYLESVVEPGEELARGEYYWHEVVGSTVRGLDGTELGTVVDVYRVGVTEVYVVRGDRFGEFDVPGVRDIVRILAPNRGEIVIDADTLDLQPPRARPVRPPRPRRTRRKGGPAPSSTPPEISSSDPPEEP
jgi:16S rRNA processing protein RimM